jgi:glycosyltransferase involved in cell wall biosynthesis
MQRLGAVCGIIAPALGKSSSRTTLADDPELPTLTRTARAWGPRWPGRNEWFWVRAGRALFDDYVRIYGRPDVVHAHCCWPAGILAHAIAKREGIPYLVTEHRTNFAEGSLRSWQRRAARQVLSLASARIAVSPQLGSIMVAQFPDEMTDWHFVPNVLSATFQDCLISPKDGTRPLTFLSVAHLGRRKNHDGLMRAFAKCFSGNARVRLEIVGEGGERRSLQELAGSLGIAAQVSLLGALPIDQVRRRMELADAFVLASKAETFGVVLIEALAAGLPIIATDCCGPDCIVRPENGLLVPPGSDGALAAALQEMAATIDRFDRHAIRADALARYAPEVVGQILLRLAESARQAPARPYSGMI